MRNVQEEIFGPVLVVQKFRDEEEAITLANHTVFGLGGYKQSGIGRGQGNIRTR